MTLHVLEAETDSGNHPIDVLEALAIGEDWDYNRTEENELEINFEAQEATYALTFNWMQGIESLHVACAFDLKVPLQRQAEIGKLLRLVNEQLWIGHFDAWFDEGVVIFRNALLLTAGATVSDNQCGAMAQSAADSCDMYYTAFQTVVWAGTSADDAVKNVMFITEGEA